MIFLSLVIIIIIISLIERASIKNALKNIHYEINSTMDIVEPGQEFELVSVLVNESKRYVNYLSVTEKFSKKLILKSKNAELRFNSVQLFSTHFLVPLQKLERKIKVIAPKRGKYTILDTTLCEGDFLGIHKTSKSYGKYNEVIAIPKETSIPTININLAGFIGEVSASRFIFEDPVLTVGYNDYTGQEPLRTISWTQTARTGKTTVKKFDYTLEPTVAIILNMDYICEDEERYIALSEECFSIARTTCQYLENKNIKYKFFTNALIPGIKHTWENHYMGGGNMYLMNILECLGRASYDNIGSFQEILEKSKKHSEFGQGYIIITPEIDEVCKIGAEALRVATGISPLILVASDISY